MDLAEGQYGLVTRQQAFDTGLTRRQIQHRIESGRWKLVFPTVYRIAGAPVTKRQTALAACLWLGDDAVVSHLPAAALLRLDRIRTSGLHLTVPRHVRRATTAVAHFSLCRVT